jgi:hypothetical protein
LFLPFSIKIPIHAAAVVLIAIMSVYVYQKEEQQHVPPRTVAAPQPQLEPQADANTIQNFRPSAPHESKRSAETKPPQDLRNPPRRPESLPSKPPQIAKATEARPGSSGEIRSHPPIRAQGVIATTGPSAPAAFRDPGFRPFSGARGFPNLGEPVADYELVVRRREARQGVRKTVTEESPRDENSTTAQLELDSASAVEIQWYVIARDRYDDFKKEVSARATIESENVIGASDRQGSFRSDGPFYIKVLVLAPLDR